MKKFLLFSLAVLVWIVIIGATKYVDNNGEGYAVYPQVISATPSAPFTCDVNQIAKQIYVDDTDDTAEAYLCFCGTDADDTSYIWLKVENPAADCF
jgi:hypothetical protein